MATTKINNQNDKSQETWSLSVDKNSIFTNDDVIDAYLKGKEDGVKEKKQIFIDKLNENLTKSATHTERMLSFLRKRKLNPVSAHLKINAYDDFVILITLPENEFISQDSLVSYDFAATIEEEVQADKYYNVMFMFSDREQNDEIFNKNLLVSDGFFMDYKMKDSIEA